MQTVLKSCAGQACLAEMQTPYSVPLIYTVDYFASTSIVTTIKPLQIQILYLSGTIATSDLSNSQRPSLISSVSFVHFFLTIISTQVSGTWGNCTEFPSPGLVPERTGIGNHERSGYLRYLKEQNTYVCMCIFSICDIVR